jgi:hypothetical protein
MLRNLSSPSWSTITTISEGGSLHTLIRVPLKLVEMSEFLALTIFLLTFQMEKRPLVF